jgi:hypothetical protein
MKGGAGMQQVRKLARQIAGGVSLRFTHPAALQSTALSSETEARPVHAGRPWKVDEHEVKDRVRARPVM